MYSCRDMPCIFPRYIYLNSTPCTKNVDRPRAPCGGKSRQKRDFTVMALQQHFCNCSGCPKVAINLKDCLRPLLLLRCGLFRPSAPPHCFRHRWAERMLIKEIDAGAMEHQHV